MAISPWQTDFHRPVAPDAPVLNLVLYIRPAWFLDVARCATASRSFGRVRIEVTDHPGRPVLETACAMAKPDPEHGAIEERLCTLTQAANDQTRHCTARGAAFTGRPEAQGCARHAFRIRNPLRLFRADPAGLPDLDAVARKVGLLRPHFYQLFRDQVGVALNIYVNALRIEQRWARRSRPTCRSPTSASTGGFDRGFSSQASLSRSFISNGVIAPSADRRSVQAPLGARAARARPDAQHHDRTLCCAPGPRLPLA